MATLPECIGQLTALQGWRLASRRTRSPRSTSPYRRPPRRVVPSVAPFDAGFCDSVLDSEAPGISASNICLDQIALIGGGE